MLSLTFNAPKEAFDDESEYLFQGKSVDDLFFPMHMNLRFFGMTPLPTFASFDVMKNADIENDFQRFSTHIQKTF
jgi:modulator of drug activity B